MMSVSSEFAEQLKRFIAVIILTKAIFGYVQFAHLWHHTTKLKILAWNSQIKLISVKSLETIWAQTTDDHKFYFQTMR